MKLILLFFFAIFFVACSTKIETKEVYIPIKCNIPYPQKQKNTGDIIQNQKHLTMYTMELEAALDCCIKGICK